MVRGGLTPWFPFRSGPVKSDGPAPRGPILTVRTVRPVPDGRDK